MSQISDAIAAANASADKAIARAQADHSGLEQQISDLQAKLAAAGTPDPADVQALADLQAKLDALDPENPSTLPPDTGTPPDQTQPPAPDQGGAPA
jgi:hypothetical protein